MNIVSPHLAKYYITQCRACKHGGEGRGRKMGWVHAEREEGEVRGKMRRRRLNCKKNYNI